MADLTKEERKAVLEHEARDVLNVLLPELLHRKGGNGAVKMTWLVGVLTTVALLAGGGWIGFVHSQVAGVQADQKQETGKRAEIERKVDVLTEKVIRVEKDQQEIKAEQKDTNRKLDEIRDLLRRGR